MRFRNISHWANDASLDGLRFFAQRLDEMLFDFTLDSYKPSALNASYLAKEALILISEIESEVIDYANLGHVLEELVWSVKNDKVAKDLIDADIEYYTAIANEGELASLKLRLEVLDRSINPKRYRQAVIAELIEKIVTSEKQAIDFLSRTLITNLINSGVSKQHLYNVTLDHFFNEENKISDLSSVGDFLAKISPKMHKFDVFLLVSSNIQDVSSSITTFRLKILDAAPDTIADLTKDDSLTAGTNEVYVQAVDIEAQDAFSARQRAIGNLDNLSDLLSLFQHRGRITWRSNVVVVQKCCDKGIQLVQPPRGPMEKASDLRPEKAAKELNTLLRSFAAKGMSFQKFNRVADIHGICISHNIVDNQLVNLWTALETLTPSHSRGSKISNITSATLPFLLHSYIGRLVQQFTYDLTNWDRWRAKKILNKVPCDPKTPLLGKSLRLLCLEENTALRAQLYETLKDFHLLRYRAFRLSEILSDRRKIRDLMALHEKKVSWQIRRIYRTRNLIVHSGHTPPAYIDTLVENGHEYLDSIIFEVMRISCGPYSATSLEQVFEIAKIKHQVFSRHLADNNPLTSESCDFLLGSKREILLE